MILSFSIAGYIINISLTPTDWSVKKILLIESIKKHFGDFIIPSAKNCDAHIIINEIRGIPFLTSKGKTYSQCFKKIRKNVYETYYHVSIFELSQLLIIILIDLLGTRGFLLHATGVHEKKGVILFTGESGSGKSTAIQLLSKQYLPFADDCVVIKKREKKYVSYQIPWIEKDNVQIVKSPHPKNISHIYIVKKSTTFDVVKINTTQLLYEMTKNAWIINSLSKKTIIAISKFVNSGSMGSILSFNLKNQRHLLECIKTS
ncbi:MAG: hypothetical protein NTZ55_04750 [Candidatus Roizmanbacteria bacterium]|nr:hypothetical protein [Candidatus Roizmanbacteria bacterium]